MIKFLNFIRYLIQDSPLLPSKGKTLFLSYYVYGTFQRAPRVRPYFKIFPAVEKSIAFGDWASN
jgi:hypothetical protein